MAPYITRGGNGPVAGVSCWHVGRAGARIPFSRNLTRASRPAPLFTPGCESDGVFRTKGMARRHRLKKGGESTQM